MSRSVHASPAHGSKMNEFNSDLVIPLILVVLAAALATVAVLRAARERSRAARRVREEPNSHYTAELVREGETRDRWHSIALEQIHEINRGEVVRLIARLDASGVESLRPGERTFLDRMADISGVEVAAPPRGKGAQIAPDLRHRPA